MKAHLIPFRKQPVQEMEVLYIMWHTSPGQMPAKHRYMSDSKDAVWAWVPDRRMRRGLVTQSCQAAHKKWGEGRYYRPPRGKIATPVRIFGGKKWKWYWLYK